MRRVRRSKLPSCGLMSLIAHGAAAALIASAPVGRSAPAGSAATTPVLTFVELRDPPPAVPAPAATATATTTPSPQPAPLRSGRRVATVARRHRPTTTPLVAPSARLHREIPRDDVAPTAHPVSPPVSAPAAPAQPALAAALPAGTGTSPGATVVSDAPEPRWLDAGDARYLRIRDSFPGLPDHLRSGPGPYVVLTRICVGASGQVTSVGIEQGADPALDGAIAAAVRGWLYRPLMVAGVPRAFCHLMRFNYTLG
jgi:hypothetical protein